MAEVPLEQLKLRLWPRGDDAHAFALLDGARDPAVYDLVTRPGCASRCLYIGELAPALARAAPYLVHLSRESPVAQALFEAAWGRAWGVFLRAPVSMAAAHNHFRRLLRVQDERGVRMLFRYYDPRVLRAYLPTCRADELAQVFGPVECFVAESEEGNIVQFRSSDGALRRDETRVAKHLPWLGDYLRRSRAEEGRS